MRASPLLVLVVAVLAACAPSRSPAPSLLPDLPAGSGLVFVYADGEAGNRGPWSALAVASASGSLVPLRLGAAEAGPLPRRRLLASGAVPAGSYGAIVLTRAVKGAESEDIRVPLSFAVGDASGAVLALHPGSGTSLEGRIVPRSATGSTGFAACPSGGYVAMFDKRSGQVFGVVPAGRGLSSIALDVERRRAYVALRDDDAVATIDLDQGELLERRTLRTGDAPVDLALLPDGRTLVVAARDASSLVLVDTQSLTETDRIEVPNGPVSVVVDRRGLQAFVVSRAANAVSLVDLTARRLTRTAGIDAAPFRAQLDAAQTTLWILYEGAPYLDAVDARSLETSARLNLGAGGTAFRIEPRTGRLLVARRDGGGVDVYDPLSRLPVETLSGIGRAAYLTVDAESNVLFAAVPDSAAVDAVGLVGRAAPWRVPVGAGPAFVAVVGER